MEKEKKEILLQIEHILVEKFGTESSLLFEKYYDDPLTGKKWGFDGNTLVMLFFELEKQFKIRIGGNFLDNYGMITVRSCADVIYRITKDVLRETGA